MWTDYYLMFADGAAFALVKAELVGAGAVVDDICTVYRLDTFEACDGYHVNARLAEGVAFPAGLEAYRIAPPALPKRVFMAG